MRVSTFMMGLFIVSVGLVTVRFGFKSVAVQASPPIALLFRSPERIPVDSGVQK
ncbi:hypothetical protein AK812_SmicGene48064, partial [Symbiodinium microadriaticum]